MTVFTMTVSTMTIQYRLWTGISNRTYCLVCFFHLVNECLVVLLGTQSLSRKGHSTSSLVIHCYSYIMYSFSTFRPR